MNSLKYIFYITSIFLLFITCKKREKLDLSTIQTYHHIAIPLVNSQIGIDELLKRDTGGLVTTNPQTGEILLAYESSSISIDAASIIKLPNDTFSSSVFPDPVNSIPIGISVDTTITFIKSLSFPNNEELKSINFSYGEFTLNIANNLRHEVDVKINIPSLVRKNTSSLISYDQDFLIDPNDSIDTLTNLGDYIFDLTLGSPNYNQMKIEFIVTINGSGSSIIIGEDLTIDFTMENLEFSRIDGDLKSREIPIAPSTVNLSIFNVSNSALNFSLTNPKIEHTIVNSFGFSADLGMNTMYYENLSGGVQRDIKYDFFGITPLSAPFTFSPSIEKPYLDGDSTITRIFMDNNNSNIDSLVNATPKTVTSSPFVKLNPNPLTDTTNYILSTSKISVSTEITLPLEGYAEGWIMRDTIPFNAKVDELFSSETSIDSAIIKFTTTNYFPLDVKIDLILLDSTSTTIDTIADSELIIASGVIDANGKITTAQAVPTKLPCDGTCVDNLNNTRFIILRLSIGTTGVSSQESVKIYDDYKIELDIALLISGRMF